MNNDKSAVDALGFYPASDFGVLTKLIQQPKHMVSTIPLCHIHAVTICLYIHLVFVHASM
jgi:hypothetical protein